MCSSVQGVPFLLLRCRAAARPVMNGPILAPHLRAPRGLLNRPACSSHNSTRRCGWVDTKQPRATAGSPARSKAPHLFDRTCIAKPSGLSVGTSARRTRLTSAAAAVPGSRYSAHSFSARSSSSCLQQGGRAIGA
jgi:hypothetical protein